MNIFTKFSTRQLFYSITIISGASVLYALYSEYYLGFEPCPLCIAERVIISVITLLSLIYALHNPLGWIRKVYSLILIACAAFGIKTAIHHQWLMGLPPEQQPVSCGMPLGVLYDRVPLHSFLHTILQGDAECGKVSWKILGLTPPVAVIILCSLIILITLIIFFRQARTK